MSHEIKEHDIVFATEPTWHGLESIVDPERTRDFTAGPWDYEAGETPIYTQAGTEIPGYKQITAPDIRGGKHPDLTLQVAKSTYGVVQNSQLFDVVVEGLVGVDYTITAIGTLDNRRRVFLSLALDGKQEYVVNGDRFKSCINALSSHDGSASILLGDSNTRVVCMNTFQQAFHGAAGELHEKIRHTSGASIRVANLAGQVESLLVKRDEFYTSLEYLASVELSIDDARAFVVAHSIGGPVSKATERKKRPAREVFNLFTKGEGNRGQTAYDLWNGYTQQYTRKAVLSDAVKNQASSEWGGGSKRKQDAYAALADDDKRVELIAAGQEWIKA